MKKHIESICNYISFPAEATAFFLDAWEKIASDAEALAVWNSWIDAYEKDVNIDYGQAMKETQEASAKVGVHQYTSDELLFLCFGRGLKQYYARKNLSDQIYHDSMSDLLWKLRECKKGYDIWGSFVAGWFPGFFQLTRFALGRLQFELCDFPAKYEECGRTKPAPFEKAINMHIPSAGKLTRENAEDAFRQAKDFYADVFPGEIVPFCCFSWLLYEPHREFIAPDSGIAGFMDWFDIYYNHDGGHDMWRVFYRFDEEEHPEDLPEDTALRRGYKKRLLEKKGTGSGEGVFYYSRTKDCFFKSI